MSLSIFLISFVVIGIIIAAQDYYRFSETMRAADTEYGRSDANTTE